MQDYELDMSLPRPKESLQDYSFKAEIISITDDIISLLVSKRHDYGDSFETIWDTFGMLSVVVRLNDKISRLNNLTTGEKNPQNETIEDTFKDIIGYCLLALRKLRIDLKFKNKEIIKVR